MFSLATLKCFIFLLINTNVKKNACLKGCLQYRSWNCSQNCTIVPKSSHYNIIKVCWQCKLRLWYFNWRQMHLVILFIIFSSILFLRYRTAFYFRGSEVVIYDWSKGWNKCIRPLLSTFPKKINKKLNRNWFSVQMSIIKKKKKEKEVLNNTKINQYYCQT